jgi:hypothetical protein
MLVTVVSSIGAYFVFIYQLPERVALQLTGWQALAFQYRGPILMKQNGFVYTVPLYAKGAILGPFYGDLLIEWKLSSLAQSSGSPAVTDLIVASLEDSEDPYEVVKQFGRLDLNALRSRSRSWYQGAVTEGIVRVRGRMLNATIRPDADRETVMFQVVLPAKEWVEVSRDVRTSLEVLTPWVLAGENVAAQDIAIFRGWLAVKGHGELLIEDGKRVAILLRAKHQNYSEKTAVEGPASSRIEIISPDGEEVAAIEGPIVLMVLGNQDREMLIRLFGDFRTVVCFKCDLYLRAFRMYAPVFEHFHVEEAEGLLEVGLEKHELSRSANVYLSGKSLEIVEHTQTRLRLQGNADRIFLNDVSLTRSPWNWVPNEIKAVLIASLLALLGWVFKDRVGKLMKGRMGSRRAI